MLWAIGIRKENEFTVIRAEALYYAHHAFKRYSENFYPAFPANQTSHWFCKALD